MTLPRYIYKYSDVKGYNRTFAQLIDEYTLYPEVELGAGDRFR